MKSKWGRLLLGAVIWTLIFLLPYFVAYGRVPTEHLLKGRGVVHLISTALLIVYWYVNYHLLVPRFFLTRKYRVYVPLVLGCILLVLWFPNVFHSGPPADLGPQGKPTGPPRGGPPNPFLFGLGYNLLLFVISTLGAIGIRLRLQLLEVQKEKLDTELAFLKSQINPHFLFNTLNSIYALAIQKSDDTPTAIVQLSELMRYLLKDSHADFVALSKELHYIHNYIALQKGRLGDTVVLHYTAPDSVGNEKIAPLVLMPFIENAFKHGVNPDQDSEISVSIQVANDTLRLAVSNKKVTSVSQEGVIGIGLQNTSARLAHLYPNKHHLQISDTGKIYSVNLTIELT